MRKIFISYRRDDADEAAGRLSDHLVSQFGQDSIFMDVDGIAPGRDFRKVIEETLTQCDVLLGVMGKNWLDIKDESGKRRLENESDFVRLEIASALRRDIPVIPVRVQGASIPKPDQLPGDLQDFSYRNAVELTHERWNSDVQVLVEKLRQLFAQTEPCPPVTPSGPAQYVAPQPFSPPPAAPPNRFPQQPPLNPGGAQISSATAPASPQKRSVKPIVRWSLVGLFFLSFFGSISNGDVSTMTLSLILFVFFAWDPFKWFRPKS
jgi:TIR domain